MMGRRWIGFVSRRWFSGRRESGGSASSFLAASGIAIGVAALVVVLGVMNGFQLGFIDSILEVSSFHVRVEDEGKPGAAQGPNEGLVSRIAAEPGVLSVLPFSETRCLLSTRDGRAFPLTLRAMPDDAARRDPGMMKTLGIEKPGSWNSGGGMILGAELARYMDLVPGSEVDLLVVSAGGEEGAEAKTVKVRIDGLFRSGYYAFDFGMAVLPYSAKAAASIFPADGTRLFVYGIKLRNRYSDGALAERLRVDLGLGSDRVESWRDYNRAFFGALRTEKIVMMLLIGLIFLVVGVNIFHSMRRAVAEKTEDIAVLKAMGASPEELKQVFIIDGLVIGAGGALLGLALGLLVAVNINEVFAIVEALVNGIASLAARIIGGLGGSDFRVFSPQYFYLLEVPVRVLFPETFFVTAAAIASSAAAAATAAGRMSRLAPAEVLRYE
ncbi:MAG: ABC transporter permease [Rectinemataceae bacterium]|jgi:lipoprotein-releasing system permease protein